MGERARLVARSLQRVQREEDRQGGHTERGEKGRERGAAACLACRDATLLAHHGLLALGRSLERAFAVAEEIEFVAELWWRARCVGTPATLNRLTSARPAVKASCGASMDGAVEKATGSSRKSTWSEAKKASTCLERACLWSRAAW